MNRFRPCAGDRGVGSLALVSAMLLLITLGVLYLSQSLVSEQRAAAAAGNRLAAQEAAEAGLTWALQMLNRPDPVGTGCATDTSASGASFRQRYAQPAGPGTPVTPVKAAPGCKIGAAGLRCSCPAASGSSLVGASLTGADGSFTVLMTPVQDAQGVVQTDALRITATGCSAHEGACNPGVKAGVSGGPDAVSQASVVVKVMPLVRSRPGAALTCAGNCQLGSTMRVSNRDTNTNGVLVNAGGTISGCTRSTCMPLQGTPHMEALRASDNTLSDAVAKDATCSSSILFRRYFHQTLADFAESPGVASLNACSSGAACSQQLTSALALGYRAFVLPAGFVLEGTAGATVGSDSDPLVLVARGPLRISGGSALHAMVYLNDPSAQNFVLENTTLRGSVVACGSVNLNRTATLEYASQTLANLVRFPSLFRRVAGSWTDLCSASSQATVTCR